MKKNVFYIPFLSLLLLGCTDSEVTIEPKELEPTTSEIQTHEENLDEPSVEDTTTEEKEAEIEDEKPIENEVVVEKELNEKTTNIFEGYTLIEVDGGNLSGHRQPNVVVDIGYDSREYWAFTNEHGQLVRVVAEEIILQDDTKEKVNSSGRYYNDEAKVPGVESEHLDEGHIIADSLGGVSNAYNITPQNSTLNRHGDQAYMEKVIRDAGGATNFEAIITYPDSNTQIPSHYQYTYTVRGNTVTDSFENINPDEKNESLGLTSPPKETNTNTSNTSNDLSSVDANSNGQVTIKEAKDAGFEMPITSDHWLYQYMDDRDGDGSVGE